MKLNNLWSFSSKQFDIGKKCELICSKFKMTMDSILFSSIRIKGVDGIKRAHFIRYQHVWAFVRRTPVKTEKNRRVSILSHTSQKSCGPEITHAKLSFMLDWNKLPLAALIAGYRWRKCESYLKLILRLK